MPAVGLHRPPRFKARVRTAADWPLPPRWNGSKIASKIGLGDAGPRSSTRSTSRPRPPRPHLNAGAGRRELPALPDHVVEGPLDLLDAHRRLRPSPSPSKAQAAAQALGLEGRRRRRSPRARFDQIDLLPRASSRLLASRRARVSSWPTSIPVHPPVSRSMRSMLASRRDGSWRIRPIAACSGPGASAARGRRREAGAAGRR